MANVHSAARAAPLAQLDLPPPSKGRVQARPAALSQLRLQAVPRLPTSRREAWLLAGLAAALHGGVLYWALQTPTPVLPVVPPEIPPMTIEFSRPAPPVEQPPPVPPPPPPPVAEPPPPVVDELAAKPAPKPVPKPKPVIKPPPKAPPPEATKPVPAPPPVAPAPAPVPVAAPAAPPAPAPITPPSASAGYLKNPAPEYPALAQRRNWEGTVLLRVHVLPSGSPAEIQVQQSAGRQQLDDAAVAAVKRWSFVPAKQGGQPVEGWVTVPIDFKIR